MPIVFNCDCGKTLKVSDEHAGRRVKCPACKGVTFVPGGEEPQFEIVEDEKPSRKDSLAKRAAEEREDDEEEVTRGYTVKKATRAEEEAEEEELEERKRRRKKKRRRRRPPPNNSSRSFEGSIINAGVMGGALAMLIAVVWFVVALSLGWFACYPPILFVIGLVGFIKGLVNGE